ncbi:DNA sulfur modification protein DndB [Pantoea ananatis]|uniref:DNA sulfur modification protein DndB n=1 Tax=Pantoea ananas TaxID=553 RepID=UPI0021B4557E|nr:DNA sulfur modification protein DndB [Pantoea ananatis]
MSRILLPCMRGAIGDWVTYTCLMKLEDIGELVKFADDIHKNKKLSRMIQRELNKERRKSIGEYLLTDSEAFFNAIVVAIYEGEPKWHPFDSIKPNDIDTNDLSIPDYALESMGYLSLTKEEKIFALDGQHRLSGIKYALDKNPEVGTQQIPVIFLPHFNNDTGIKRTRRLFTTLNKKAKPVDKAAIIALDEDDISACATRYLVEDTEIFNDDKIKFQANNNIAYTDIRQITTIGNLYDLCRIICKNGLNMSSKDIDNYRGSEEDKNEILKVIESIFQSMFDILPPLREFQLTANREATIVKYRNRTNGGHFLYRPLGLRIYLLSMFKAINKKRNISDLLRECNSFLNITHDIPLWLEDYPLKNLFWDTKKNTIMILKAEERNRIIEEIMMYYESRK